MVDINLIPKEYKKKGLNLTNVFSKTGGMVLILVILSLLVFGGLFFYSRLLNKKLDNIRQEKSDLESKRDPQTELTIEKIGKKLDLAENLFKKHFYWSKLFSGIENAVIPQVYFSESKFNFIDEKVNLLLAGKARTYTAIAQQMVSFKESSSIEKIEVSNISLSESGGIDFDLSISFSKSVLLNKFEESK